MQINEAKSAELVARLETLPFSKWHRNFFILGFLGVMFDAADFALFGAALPPIAREFGLGPAQAGLMATVGLVGAFVGALFWGTVSDYIGRRTSFSATIGIFALFTGLVATSWNVASLAVWPSPHAQDSCGTRCSPARLRRRRGRAGQNHRSPRGRQPRRWHVEFFFPFETGKSNARLKNLLQTIDFSGQISALITK